MNVILLTIRGRLLHQRQVTSNILKFIIGRYNLLPILKFLNLKVTDQYCLTFKMIKLYMKDETFLLPENRVL
jgi:hypothetical protein